jgi:putative membrane protein
MGRAGVAARLEAIVLENRGTIAVVFPLVGALALVASATGRLPPAIAFHPLLLLAGTFVLRLPLVAAFAPLLTRRVAGWLGLLAGYTYAIEWVGVTTGWPYGAFSYGVDLGPTVAGIPLALPVFFVPLVVDAYLLALLATRRRYATLPVALALVLAVDLVLDPGAVALGFWTYEAGGYYGVPVSNFAGWVLSGSVGVLTVDRAVDRQSLCRRLATAPYALDDLVSFILLWSAVNAFYGQWFPVVVAAGLGVGLLGTGYDLRAFRPGTADRVA